MRRTIALLAPLAFLVGCTSAAPSPPAPAPEQGVTIGVPPSIAGFDMASRHNYPDLTTDASSVAVTSLLSTE